MTFCTTNNSIKCHLKPLNSFYVRIDPLIFIFSPLLVQYVLNDQRRIQGEGRGGCNPPLPLGSHSNLSRYPCRPLFHTQNNIISYDISSSPIDHHKRTVATPLLGSLIIQMQDRFSKGDSHARHLLCLVPSIT